MHGRQVSSSCTIATALDGEVRTITVTAGASLARLTPAEARDAASLLVELADGIEAADVLPVDVLDTADAEPALHVDAPSVEAHSSAATPSDGSSSNSPAASSGSSSS